MMIVGEKKGIRSWKLPINEKALKCFK